MHCHAISIWADERPIHKLRALRKQDCQAQVVEEVLQFPVPVERLEQTAPKNFFARIGKLFSLQQINRLQTDR